MERESPLRFVYRGVHHSITVHEVDGRCMATTRIDGSLITGSISEVSAAAIESLNNNVRWHFPAATLE